MTDNREAYGKKLYSKMSRMFREGFVSVVIYKNKYANACFFDIVIYRKIKQNGKPDWKRGANLKPSDIPDTIKLLKEADIYLKSIGAGDANINT